ncbi:ABC transporter ATP-binding protein [Spirochaeta cellobiosiphila]|uniref:ABC transporter ATP-binding protein n=1 Tax=Spirochaeta cellobiosiphila TaxID=504483 RepID=UPI0004039D1C|nr:oligopeptide/dipeptide ABC transporter ATP-binding protein [Spirochaeta cellobiosiphila]
MSKIVTVESLRTYYTLPRDTFTGPVPTVKAIDDVSFNINQGEILGVVGESGCGKSTLGRTLIRLEQKTAGTVLFSNAAYTNQDIFDMSLQELKDFRRNVQMIFQDPFSSLNPRKKIAHLLEQPMKIHNIGSYRDRNERINQLMKEVGLDPKYKNRFPHQFSGGQRQRIGIARALTVNPEFIICDEAVSALDVSVQAQILNLLLDLREKHNLTYLFISHDLAVIEFLSTRILVMYLGKIVEEAPKEELMKTRLHPYTISLFKAYPSTEPSAKNLKEKIIVGDVPSPLHPPKGCHFHPRCPLAKDRCKQEAPQLREISPGHKVACHFV